MHHQHHHRDTVLTVEIDHRVVRGALERLEVLTHRLAQGERVTRQRLREVIDSIADFERELRLARESTLRTTPRCSPRAQQRIAYEHLICSALLDDLRLRVDDLERNPGSSDRVVRAALDFITHQRECLDSVERLLQPDPSPTFLAA